MFVFLNNSIIIVRPRSNLRGIGGNILLELMVASCIGLLIIGFLFDIYISAQKSFHLQSSLSQIQDNTKTAIDRLSAEIHMAGYIGCARLTDDFPIVGYQHYIITPQNKLLTTAGSITVRHAARKNVSLIKQMQNPYMLQTNRSIRFKKNDVLIISDCKRAEIFKVKDVSYSRGMQIIIPEIPLQTMFTNDAEVARFEINHFFSANSFLYLYNIHGSKVRLIDGIKDLHIESIYNAGKISAVSITLDAFSSQLNKTWYAYVAI